jgi:hypothetical protein
MNGRDVSVSFRPMDKDDFDWKGEAFIDVHDFEPAVYTKLSRNIPIAVRVLLGTNLPGLGISVTYDREPDGVWFPVSFGTEFRCSLSRGIPRCRWPTHSLSRRTRGCGFWIG